MVTDELESDFALPDEWTWKPLGRVANHITTGKLDANAMSSYGAYRFYTCAKHIYRINSYAFDTEALLVSGNGANVGYVHYYQGKFNAYQRTYVLSKFAACPKYLYYILSSMLARRIAIEVKASNTPYITRSTLSEMEIPLPPTLREQEAIAEALSDADAYIESLEQLLAKKRDIKQGVMQNLLSGKLRLPQFHDAWKTRILADIGEVSGAGVDKKVVEGDIRVRLVNYMNAYRQTFIRAADLSHWVTAPLNQARRCAVTKGDIFFTPSSETRDDIGNSSVALESIPDAVYSYHIVRLRPTVPLDLIFSGYLFQTREFLGQCEIMCDGNGTRYVISLGKFRNMVVRIPPIDEQEAIGSILFDIDLEIQEIELKREKATAVKQGMMQELLTGRTRLV